MGMLSAHPKASGRLPQPLPTELLSREQSALGPHAAPAPVAGTPTRLASHAQKALFLRACARCPRGQGWAPHTPAPTRRSGVASSPALLPQPRSFSPPVCTEGGCNRLCHLLPGSSKGDFKTHVWTNLNRWSTHYWLQGLGDEHWEGRSETKGVTTSWVTLRESLPISEIDFLIRGFYQYIPQATFSSAIS